MRALFLLLLATVPAAIATGAPTNQAIDFDGFVEEAREARQLRASRLVDIDRFNEMAKCPGTLVLDTRSRAMYERRRLRGTYGYRNVFELADLLPVDDPRLAFDGEAVD